MDTGMQIRDYLLGKIIHHEFEEGKKLPSENEIANRFGATRNTVRKIYEMLEEMGYIYSKQGVGHFALPPKPEVELVLRGDIGFSQKMAEQGIPYQSRNVRIMRLEKDQAESMQQKGLTGTIYEVVRLRNVHGKAAALHFSYVSEETFPNIAYDGAAITSMFTYYRERGYTDFTSSGTMMTISFPTAKEMELLQCGRLVPLMILESDCWDQKSGKLLEKTKIVYRSDLFKYRLN